MKIAVRTHAFIAGICFCAAMGAGIQPASAQPAVSQGVIAPPKKDTGELGQEASQATQQALDAVRALGGSAAIAANALAKLSPAKVLDSLSVQPPTGPSTLAPPHLPPKAPVAAVNYVGTGGGTIAAHPGVVLLLAQLDGAGDFKARCTGTLVRANIILTAAHCVCDNKLYPTAAMCRDGTASLESSVLLDENRWLVFFQHLGLRTVHQVLFSNDYAFGNGGVRSDLALLVLTHSVPWITPAALPSATASPEWSEAIAAGFGFSAIPGAAASPGAAQSTIVQQLVRPGLKSQGALRAVSCDDLGFLDKNEAFCSMYDSGADGNGAAADTVRAGICPGDSGGPLWVGDTLAVDVGITSGLDDTNCAAPGTTSFEMRTDYGPHSQWIDTELTAIGLPVQQGRWPTFGDNLRYVLDRRNVALFEADGTYTAQSWAKAPENAVVLVTLNSPGKVSHLSLQDKISGKALCSSLAGFGRHIYSVDYCYATVVAGQQFRVVAQGEPNERLQFVVSNFPIGTTFPE